jgi:hypothetical protein
MADNLTAICEPIIWTKCGTLDLSHSYGPSRSVTGTTLLFLPFEVSTRKELWRGIQQFASDCTHNFLRFASFIFFLIWVGFP